jgi:16S rRNA (guanine966-N2)-methyltransferase
MRIIGGEWRGRKLEEPRGREVTRPTTDRVREAMASMVGSALESGIDGARVLDAFGGSGALGIEMLSRGAGHLTVFDLDRGASALIKRNLATVRCDPSRFKVISGDVLASAVRGRIPGGPFDLVLFDPPYAFGSDPVVDCIENLCAHGLLSRGSVVLFEHSSDIHCDTPDGFDLLKSKRYGITSVDLFTLKR